MSRNLASLLLLIVSLCLFVPGIFMPMFSIDIMGHVVTQLGEINLKVLQQNSSILETVRILFIDGRVLVAGLILLFSVIVPLLKSVLILITHFNKSASVKKRCQTIAVHIGKWSMADVFVVAIFLAFLSTHQDSRVQEQALNFMGMKIPIRFQLEVLSGLGEGFYYFLGYCLVSLASFQMYRIDGNES